MLWACLHVSLTPRTQGHVSPSTCYVVTWLWPSCSLLPLPGLSFLLSLQPRPQSPPSPAAKVHLVRLINSYTSLKSQLKDSLFCKAFTHFPDLVHHCSQGLRVPEESVKWDDFPIVSNWAESRRMLPCSWPCCLWRIHGKLCWWGPKAVWNPISWRMGLEQWVYQGSLTKGDE